MQQLMAGSAARCHSKSVHGLDATEGDLVGALHLGLCVPVCDMQVQRRGGCRVEAVSGYAEMAGRPAGAGGSAAAGTYEFTDYVCMSRCVSCLPQVAGGNVASSAVGVTAASMK